MARMAGQTSHHMALAWWVYSRKRWTFPVATEVNTGKSWSEPLEATKMRSLGSSRGAEARVQSLTAIPSSQRMLTFQGTPRPYLSSPIQVPPPYSDFSPPLFFSLCLCGSASLATLYFIFCWTEGTCHSRRFFVVVFGGFVAPSWGFYRLGISSLVPSHCTNFTPHIPLHTSASHLIFQFLFSS